MILETKKRITKEIDMTLKAFTGAIAGPVPVAYPIPGLNLATPPTYVHVFNADYNQPVGFALSETEDFSNLTMETAIVVLPRKRMATAIDNNTYLGLVTGSNGLDALALVAVTTE